jgi:hypothetical protein
MEKNKFHLDKIKKVCYNKLVPTIEIADLLEEYGEEIVIEIIKIWQNDPFLHSLTCKIHSNVVLQYENGILYCPRPYCSYHQHWIPTVLVKYWADEQH